MTKNAGTAQKALLPLQYGRPERFDNSLSSNNDK